MVNAAFVCSDSVLWEPAWRNGADTAFCWNSLSITRYRKPLQGFHSHMVTWYMKTRKRLKCCSKVSNYGCSILDFCRYPTGWYFQTHFSWYRYIHKIEPVREQIMTSRLLLRERKSEEESTPEENKEEGMERNLYSRREEVMREGHVNKCGCEPKNIFFSNEDLTETYGSCVGPQD